MLAFGGVVPLDVGLVRVVGFRAAPALCSKGCGRLQYFGDFPFEEPRSSG